jgi:hypothetical protein
MSLIAANSTRPSSTSCRITVAMNDLEMPASRNGVPRLTGSPAASAEPVAAMLAVPSRTISAATPP